MIINTLKIGKVQSKYSLSTTAISKIENRKSWAYQKNDYEWEYFLEFCFYSNILKIIFFSKIYFRWRGLHNIISKSAFIMRNCFWTTNYDNREWMPRIMPFVSTSKQIMPVWQLYVCFISSLFLRPIKENDKAYNDNDKFLR